MNLTTHQLSNGMFIAAEPHRIHVAIQEYERRIARGEPLWDLRSTVRCRRGTGRVVAANYGTHSVKVEFPDKSMAEFSFGEVELV